MAKRHKAKAKRGTVEYNSLTREIERYQDKVDDLNAAIKKELKK